MEALRSLLFTPGNKHRMIEKALGLGADAVIVDLEDSVPVAEKEETRAQLPSFKGAERPVYIRVNGDGTPWLEKDVEKAVEVGAVGIFLPKAESVETMKKLDELLAAAEARYGREPGSVEVIPMIESALGVLRCFDLLKASPRVGSVCFGSAESGDLVADLGCERSLEGTEILYARSHVLLAARAAGIEYPLDGVFMNVRDTEAFRQDCIVAKRLGYTGKTVIHPSQVAVAHEVFTPSAEELEKQRKIIEAYEQALAQGSGAITVDGQMVDYAVIRKAQRILKLGRGLQKGN